MLLTLKIMLDLIGRTGCIDINGKYFSNEMFYGENGDPCQAMFSRILSRYGEDAVVESFTQRHGTYCLNVNPTTENSDRDTIRISRVHVKWCMTVDVREFIEDVPVGHDSEYYERLVNEKIANKEITIEDAEYTDVYCDDQYTF